MILFLLGLILLIFGAKLLVFGATQFAARHNISSLITGLTIVAFGTSAPEIAIAVLAAWRQESSIVLGNVIGSNIFNILCLLGLIALLCSARVKKQLIRWDVPVMLLASAAVWAFAAFEVITVWEGLVLLLGAVVYLTLTYRLAKGEEAALPPPKISLFWQISWFIIGLLMLAFGSHYLINGVITMAARYALHPLFLSLTLVAIGTSLPELATMIVLIGKKDIDMAVGGLIGSNILNIFLVIGCGALFSRGGLTVEREVIVFDLPIMVAAAIATLPIMITGHKISRWEGALFLFYYLFYLSYLITAEATTKLQPLFFYSFWCFLAPLTLITGMIALYRHYKIR